MTDGEEIDQSVEDNTDTKAIAYSIEQAFHGFKTYIDNRREQMATSLQANAQACSDVDPLT